MSISEEVLSGEILNRGDKCDKLDNAFGGKEKISVDDCKIISEAKWINMKQIRLSTNTMNRLLFN